MFSSSLSLSAASLCLTVLASPVLAASESYQLVESWQGESFFDHFNFHTGPDPTHGFVTYLDKSSAESAGLVKVKENGSVYIGVDHTTTLSPGSAGRDSVRIRSKKYYDQSLVIADLAHMPGSICGTWPAFWSMGKNWPADGEIDIIEGVNLQDHNEIVMHTAGTCSISETGMTGAVNATGCSEDLGTTGCVIDGQQGSYGTLFNRQGGGVYALQWTDQFLKIWFFPRAFIPPSISLGKPDISQFGTPLALVEEGCDVADSFKAQSFVFDVTFCGDWAGGVFGQSGCPMTNADPVQSCVNYVAKNPDAFEQTYWQINSINIYQNIVVTPAHSSTTVASASHSSHVVVSTSRSSIAVASPSNSSTTVVSTSNSSIAFASPHSSSFTRIPSSRAMTKASAITHTQVTPAVSATTTQTAASSPASQGQNNATVTSSSVVSASPEAGNIPSSVSVLGCDGSCSAAGSTITTSTRYVTEFLASTAIACPVTETFPASAAVIDTQTLAAFSTQSCNTSNVLPTAESAKSRPWAVTNSVNEFHATSTSSPDSGSQYSNSMTYGRPTGAEPALASMPQNVSSLGRPLPTVILPPGFHYGSSSSLPILHASRTMTVIQPTGVSKSSGGAFQGSTSSAVAPAFTGAADRASVRFSAIIAAFIVALMG